MKKFFSFLLASFSLLCGLLFAEMALRFIQPQPVEQIDSHLYKSETSPRYRLNPGYRGRISNLVEFDVSVAINGSGFRGDEVGRKSTDETRLLVLGDSFVLGWGVDAGETFAAGLAERLQPAMPGIRVLNGGVPGYGPVDIVDWLERFGSELDPDIVLISFFIGNDLIDATEKHRQIDFAANVQGESFSAKAREGLYRRSHLLRLVKRAFPTNRIRGWFGLPEPWATTYLRDLLESYALDETALAREGRKASEKALDRLAELAREREFRVLISLLPGPLQAIDAQWQQGLLSLGASTEAYDPNRPAQVFRQLAEAQSWPVFDLTPAFQKAVEHDEVPLYFRYDPHWTSAGQELAARELLDFVLSEELLRSPPSTESEDALSAGVP